MKSRVDVVAIEEKTPFKEVKELVVSSGYSRIPVYKENFDTILGVLYIKDMLLHIKKENLIGRA